MRSLIVLSLCIGLSACVGYEPYPALTKEPVTLSEVPGPVLEAFHNEHPSLKIDAAATYEFHSRRHGFRDYHLRFRTPEQDFMTAHYTPEGKPGSGPPLPADDPVWE